MNQAPLMPHVRLYQTLRSAHLERAHQLEPASIVYRTKRYDFEDPLTIGLDIRRRGPLAGAWLLLRSPVTTLEINEPLMLSSLPTTAVSLVALWLRSLARKPRTAVVTYAIANADPFAPEPGQTRRARLRRKVDRWLARRVWRRVDRAAFGTSAAREIYETVLGTVELTSSARLFPALPSAFHDAGAGSDGSGRRAIAPTHVPHAGRVIFVGSFSERKGLGVLLTAWCEVHRRRPDAELVLVGKGQLEPQVRDAAASGTGIRFALDPERREIHALLDAAAVLVLPSQPMRAWREQVGLPIVEGLSHGLTIVTTEQTGLAEWLADNGHYVVTDAGSASELGEALIRAIDAPRPQQEVLASLPTRDGRLAADDWLFSRSMTISDLARVFDG